MLERRSISAGQIAQALSRLFDGLAVAVEAAIPAARVDALYREERLCIASAAAKRQAEFSTARVCARAALSRLGFAPEPLIPAPDRSPRWPAGAVGSITHTDTICAVAVARATKAETLGIDIEDASSLGDDLEHLVCTPAERRWLDAQDRRQRGRWAKLIFSAKEAFYKCQYPKSGRMLDFLDVELSLDPASAGFRARVSNGGLPDNWEAAQGRWVWIDELVLTRMLLPP